MFLLYAIKSIHTFFVIVFLSDINECTSSQHECDARATCHNTEGAYTCQCADGYFGDGYTCQRKLIKSVKYIIYCILNINLYNILLCINWLTAISAMDTRANVGLIMSVQYIIYCILNINYITSYCVSIG